MKRFNIAKTCQILTTCIALGLFTSFAHTEPKPKVQTVKPELTEVKHDFFDKFSVAENVALPNAKKFL